MKVLTIQKLMGLGLLAMSIIAAVITNGDCTLLVFSLFFAIPLIFSKQNIIGIEVEEKDRKEKE